MQYNDIYDFRSGLEDACLAGGRELELSRALLWSLEEARRRRHHLHAWDLYLPTRLEVSNQTMTKIARVHDLPEVSPKGLAFRSSPCNKKIIDVQRL